MATSFCRALCGAALLVIASGPVLADTVLPDHVQYDFEQKDDATARTCNLRTVVVGNPDSVNFRLIFAFPRDRSISYYGITIDAGDLRIENGMPHGATPAPLTDAEFISDTFDSAKQMNPTGTGDAGVAKVAPNATVGHNLVAAVTSGHFKISVARTSGDSRTYVINQPILPKTLREFQACVDTFSRRQ